MTVCIISKTKDAHALYVKSALEKKGETARIWEISTFPRNSEISISIQNNHKLRVSFLQKNISKCATWIHRGLEPSTSPETHEEDIEFAKNESQKMINAILWELEKHTFCANPIRTIFALNSKINELLYAQKSHLKIPKTIFSNNPKHIRNFLRKYKNTIIKHHTQHEWKSTETGTTLQPFTTMIYESDISSDKSISLAPSIYQEYIEKQFELRIFFTGETIIPIKINSQTNSRSIDWRFDFASRPPCETYNLPKDIEYKIRDFIKNTGLIYGSIDMIVDHYNEHYFLEVNESGQFLWIEELIPDLNILDCFASLLKEKRHDFVYKKSSKCIKLSGLREEIEEAINN